MWICTEIEMNEISICKFNHGMWTIRMEKSLQQPCLYSSINTEYVPEKHCLQACFVSPSMCFSIDENLCTKQYPDLRSIDATFCRKKGRSSLYYHCFYLEYWDELRESIKKLLQLSTLSKKLGGKATSWELIFVGGNGQPQAKRSRDGWIMDQHHNY